MSVKASSPQLQSPITPDLNLSFSPEVARCNLFNEKFECEAPVKLLCAETQCALDGDSQGWSIEQLAESTPQKETGSNLSDEAVVPALQKDPLTPVRKKAKRRSATKPACCRQLEGEYKTSASTTNNHQILHPHDPTLYSPDYQQSMYSVTRDTQASTKSVSEIWNELQPRERDTLYTLATLQTGSGKAADDIAIVPDVQGDVTLTNRGSHSDSQLVPEVPLTDVGNDYHQPHSPIGLSCHDDGCFSEFLMEVHPSEMT